MRTIRRGFLQAVLAVVGGGHARLQARNSQVHDHAKTADGAHDVETRAETLLTTRVAWDGAPYAAYPVGVPEMTIRKVTIPARSVLAWHRHPMPSAVYVVSGEVRLEDASGASRTFSAGQAFSETVNTVHRGIAGAEPAVCIVFYAGVADMPLSERQP